MNPFLILFCWFLLANELILGKWSEIKIKALEIESDKLEENTHVTPIT